MKTLLIIAITLAFIYYIIRYIKACEKIKYLTHFINTLKRQKKILISIKNRKNRKIELLEQLNTANEVIISIDKEQLSDYRRNYTFTCSKDMIKISIEYFTNMKSLYEPRLRRLRQICSEKIKPSTALADYWDTERKIDECNQSIYLLENLISEKHTRYNFYSDYIKNKEPHE